MFSDNLIIVVALVNNAKKYEQKPNKIKIKSV